MQPLPGVEYVLVKAKDTGAHIPITRELFDSNPDAYQELKSSPVGPDGELVAPSYPESSASPAANQAAKTKEK